MFTYNGFLFNENLRNIDPKSNDLGEDTKQKIVEECKKNHRYYINSFIFNNSKGDTNDIYKK